MIYPRAIIPTILIPLTLISVILSSIASFIAALFGLQLHAEGPRRLLEALLKPRVLIAGLLLNGAIYGGVKAWGFWRTLPRMEWTIQRESEAQAKTSDRAYPDSDRLAADSAFGARSSVPAREMIEWDALWDTRIQGGSFAGSALSGGSLFLGTDEGRLVEIDARTGESRRTFGVGTAVSSVPLIRGGFLYSGEGTHETHHARVYKFDLRSGRLAGVYSTRGHTEGRLVAATWEGKEYLFAPAGADGMHAIDAATMKPLWRRVEGHTDSSVTVLDDLVYWGTGRERTAETAARIWAVAAKIADGSVAWKRELPASSWMSPAAIGGDVCFPVGEIYVASEVGGVFCFDRETGEPSAAFNLGTPVVASPIVDGNGLIATTLSGRICRLEMSSRRTLWCTETDRSQDSLAEVLLERAHGLLLYASRTQGLFVLDAKDGRIVSRWQPAAPSSWESTYAPARWGLDSLILADMKGNLRALRPRWESIKKQNAGNRSGVLMNQIIRSDAAL